MVRVLHLLSKTPEFQAEQEAAAIARGCGSGFAIASRSMGRGGDFRNGFFTFLSLSTKSARSLGLVHLWDPGKYFWIIKAASANSVLWSPTRFLGSDEMDDVRLAMQKRDLHLTTSWPVEHQAYLRHDLPPQRCHLITPGVDFKGMTHGLGHTLRLALGFCEDDFVFIAPGESTKAAGHRDALWAMSILHVLSPNCKLLLWGRGEQADLCGRLADKLRQPALLTIAERKLGRRINFEDLLSSANAVISAAPGKTPVLPLAMCMAAGLPIVATETRWTADLLRDGGTGVLVPPGSPRRLAQRALEVMNDPAFRASIGKNASHEAAVKFAPGKFVAGYRELYKKIAAEK